MDLPAPEAPLHERLAMLVDELSGRLLGESGLSGLGAVVGATEPEHIARLRELMPRSVFLLPGVGAQGGDPALLGAAFAPGPAGGARLLLARDRRRPRPGRRRRGTPGDALGDLGRLTRGRAVSLHLPLRSRPDPALSPGPGTPVR